MRYVIQCGSQCSLQKLNIFLKLINRLQRCYECVLLSQRTQVKFPALTSGVSCTPVTLAPGRPDASELRRQLQEHAAKPHTNTPCALVKYLPSINEAPDVILRTTYIVYFILYYYHSSQWMLALVFCVITWHTQHTNIKPNFLWSDNHISRKCKHRTVWLEIWINPP